MGARSMAGRTVVVLLALVVLTGSAPSQADDPAWAEGVFDDLQTMVAAYNANVDDPDVGTVERGLQRQIRDERVNLRVTAADGTEATFSFRTDDQGHIVGLSRNEDDDAAVLVTASRATIENVAAADDPADAFVQAVSDGDVVIEGRTMKWTVVEVFQAVATADPAVVAAAVVGTSLLAVAAAKFGTEGGVVVAGKSVAVARGVPGKAAELARDAVSLGRSVVEGMGELTESVNTFDSFLNLLDRLGLLTPLAVFWKKVRRGMAAVRDRVRRRLAAVRSRLRRGQSRG
ncbi:hypothetical protein ACFQH6_00435 [Halobacteriaceae archaeon GCM10025711]